MREDEEPEFISVVSRHHHIERDVGKMLERIETDIGSAHPRAAHQLKVFRDAAVEVQPGIRVVEIDELHGVVGDEEALLIKRLLRFLRLLIVALEDIRSFETQLATAIFVWDEL